MLKPVRIYAVSVQAISPSKIVSHAAAVVYTNDESQVQAIAIAELAKALPSLAQCDVTVSIALVTDAAVKAAYQTMEQAQ